MTVYYNPANTGAEDGLSVATGWNAFGDYTPVAGEEVRIASAGDPENLATGGRTFTWTVNSLTIIYTGSTLVGTLVDTDFIAKPSLYSDELEVPYQVQSVTWDGDTTTGTITLYDLYQGDTAAGAGCIRIPMFTSYANMSNILGTGNIISGGWKTGDTTTPSGYASWFKRTGTTGTDTLLTITSGTLRNMSITGIGFCRGLSVFNDDSYDAANNYIHNVWAVSCTVGFFALYNAPVSWQYGTVYNCHSSSTNQPFPIGSSCNIDTLIVYNTNLASFSTCYGDSHIRRLYARKTLRAFSMQSNNSIHVKELYARRNGTLIHGIGCGAHILHSIVENADNSSQFDTTAYYDYRVRQIDYPSIIENWNGQQRYLHPAGYIDRDTIEAYNTECLKFTTTISTTHPVFMLQKNKLFAKVSNSSNTTLSFIAKRSSGFNGTLQYSVWYQNVKIVDWSTAITLTTDYTEYSVIVPYTAINAYSEFAELRIAVQGTTGYVYLAERNGQYVRIEYIDLLITTTTLPEATVGETYSVTPATVGGALPFTWSVVSGTITSGLSLNTSTGAITGTPTDAGALAFTLRCTDSTNNYDDQALTITINAATSSEVVIMEPIDSTDPDVSSLLDDAVVGTAYSHTLTAMGGTSPYTWLLQAGILPPGLTLSSAGVISGTPTTSGTYEFTIRCTDSTSAYDDHVCTIIVNES